MSVSIVLYSTLVASVTSRFPEVVREQEHAVAPEEPRAVDDVRLALADELDQLRILFRRVLEVGVLDDHQVAGDRGEPAPQRRALAGVGLAQQREAELALQGVEDLARAVGRSVVDDDQLEAQRHGEHAANDFVNRGTLVEHGHHDRQQRISVDHGRAPPYHTMKRLVILAPNWLGDAVMAQPAIADVRRQMPDATIALAARGAIASLYGMVPDVDETLAVDGLSRHRFDAALLLPNSFQSALAAFRAGIPERWGYRTDWRGPLLTRSVRRTPGLHQVESYQQLVRELGFPADRRCRASS